MLLFLFAKFATYVIKHYVEVLFPHFICRLETKVYICSMKKELGKWLMDIAKYITTAVVLTSIFGEVEQKWIIYAGGVLAVACTLGWGLYLVKDKKEGE